MTASTQHVCLPTFGTHCTVLQNVFVATLQGILTAEVAQLNAARPTKSVHWLKELAGAGVLAAFNPYAAAGYLVVSQIAKRYMKD